MKVKQRQYILLVSASTLSLSVFFQIQYLNIHWVGWIIFTLISFCLGLFWHDVLSKVFRLKSRRIITYILGIFAGFLLWGSITSFFIIFFKFNAIVASISFLAASISSFLIDYFSTRSFAKLKRQNKDFSLRRYLLFTRHNLLLFLYGVVWIISFYFLINSSGIQTVFSPWAVINKAYVYFFFILTLLLLCILFSRHKTKTILFIIIAHSVLMHLYLPASHNQPFGGDVWRHMGYEKILLKGQAIEPVLFGKNIKTIKQSFIPIPEVFVKVQKISYSFTWGTVATISKLTSSSLEVLHKWILPLTWSTVVPVIFFQVGLILFRSLRQSLFLSAFSIVPFSLQALGSLSLPVSFGYLAFFFILMLWLAYLRDGDEQQKRITFIFSGLMLFGYLLHALLIWATILLSSLWRIMGKLKNVLIEKVAKYSLILISFILVPVVEIGWNLSETSSFRPFRSLYEFSLLISGWTYTQVIQAGDTLVGNIIINHTPDYAFLSSIFTDRRYHIFGVMVILLISFGVGIYKLIQSKEVKWKAVGLLIGIGFFGYFIGWYFLSGDRLLTRRMDGLLAFLFGVVVISGLWKMFSWLEKILTRGYLRTLFGVSILLGGWFMVTVYVSGPDMRVMSNDEKKSAEYVWAHMDKSQEKNCVLGNTWVLLRLESLSAHRIVGGGFPIDYQFAQPERVSLLKEMVTHPRPPLLEKSHRLTGADKCWLVLPAKKLLNKKIKRINKITSSSPKYIGEFAIFEEKKATVEQKHQIR